MDPNEIIKAAPDIAKGAGALAAAIPFTSIVKRMLGPAADEVAEMWRDQVRMYRYERQLKCVEKAERMAQEAGFRPQAVPPKILFPLLEGASLEEDDKLHDMWASLLANAASSDTANKVRPSFIVLLKQMAPDEAALLNIMYEKPLLSHVSIYSLDHNDVCQLLAKATDSDRDVGDQVETCGYVLRSAGLIDFKNRFEPSEIRYTLTAFGKTFIQACRPPKPKE